jgi:GYF domain 2
MSIFISREEQEVGPLSGTEVSDRLNAGEFGPDDYARTEQMGEWNTLAEVLRMMQVSSGDSLGATQAFVQRWDVLKNLPLVILGVGAKSNDAWNFTSRNKGIPVKVIAVSDFDPKDSFHLSKIPPGGGISCPALFVYQEKEADRVKNAAQAKAQIDRLQAIGNYIGASKEQNHIAISHVIPGVVPWEQEQQQSMQVAGDFIDTVLGNKIGELLP